MDQWQRELARHAPQLRLLAYHGLPNGKERAHGALVWAADFCSADVVCVYVYVLALFFLRYFKTNQRIPPKL
jgi:SNF2 family DNA or RNA helicase